MACDGGKGRVGATVTNYAHTMRVRGLSGSTPGTGVLECGVGGEGGERRVLGVNEVSLRLVTLVLRRQQAGVGSIVKVGSSPVGATGIVQIHGHVHFRAGGQGCGVGSVGG